MFAGKTTRLVERLAAEQQAGRAVVAAKPRIDTRYHPTDIVTHTGRAIPAHAIDHPRELAALARGVAVLGLDEAHFFEDGLRDAAHALVSRGLTVILAGLDRTSLNQPFGEMGALLIEADEVIKLTAPCAVCRRPAVHTVRLFDSTESIVVGGEGMFENRCRAHLHDPPPNASAAARPR
jgi:thymidine kinase